MPTLTGSGNGRGWTSHVTGLVELKGTCMQMCAQITKKRNGDKEKKTFHGAFYFLSLDEKSQLFSVVHVPRELIVPCLLEVQSGIISHF